MSVYDCDCSSGAVDRWESGMERKLKMNWVERVVVSGKE